MNKFDFKKEKIKTTFTILLLPILVVILNFIVKGIFISNNSIGGDEPFSIYHAQMDIFSIIGQLSKGNNPPLYELLLHFWIKIFGISEISVRMPSLIFSSLTALFTYKIGQKFFNQRIALYASLIFVFSNYHIIFAHEARVYALFGMLTAMSIYYFLLIIINKTKWKINIVILVAINTILIYSHYFGFFVLFIEFAFIICHRKIFKENKHILLILAGTITLLYLPNIPTFFNRFFVSSVGGTWVKTPIGMDSLYNMLRGFTNAPVVTTLTIALLVVSLIKIFVKRPVIIDKQTLYIAVSFLFPFFFMFIVSYKVPMFLDRYLMFVSIPFILLLAIISDRIVQKKKFNFIVPAIIMVLFIATVKPKISNKRNVEETVEAIKELKNDNTLILISPHHFLLNISYYYDIEIFKNYNTKNIYENINNDFKASNIYGINNITQIDYINWKHIVFLDAAADFSNPNNNILNSLNEHYVLDKKLDFYEIFKVYEYKQNK